MYDSEWERISTHHRVTGYEEQHTESVLGRDTVGGLLVLGAVLLRITDL